MYRGAEPVGQIGTPQPFSAPVVESTWSVTLCTLIVVASAIALLFAYKAASHGVSLALRRWKERKARQQKLFEAQTTLKRKQKQRKSLRQYAMDEEALIAMQREESIAELEDS